MSWLFGSAASAPAPAVKEVDLKEKQREWQRKLQHQIRDIDKNVRDIERAQAQTKLNIKKAIKDKQMVGATMLAKELVQSDKAKERLLTCKFHVENIGTQLKLAAANLRVTGSLSKCGDIMRDMNALMKGPETVAVARDLAQEFSRFGIMEEMVGEQMDAVMDVDGDLDELADGQVQAVIQEIMSGIKLHSAGSKAAAAAAQPVAADPDADLERRMRELDK
jgi:charged multivesicular body protein 3